MYTKCIYIYVNQSVLTNEYVCFCNPHFYRDIELFHLLRKFPHDLSSNSPRIYCFSYCLCSNPLPYWPSPLRRSITALGGHCYWWEHVRPLMYLPGQSTIPCNKQSKYSWTLWEKRPEVSGTPNRRGGSQIMSLQSVAAAGGGGGGNGSSSSSKGLLNEEPSMECQAGAFRMV